MAKQERTRKSAPQNRVKSFIDAPNEVIPTIPLNLDEMIRFQAIIESREAVTWSPADVHLATQMAQTEFEMVLQRLKYLEQGPTIYAGDKPVVNPEFTIYKDLFTQAKEMRRMLGLSASQKGISGKKQVGRNQQDFQAAEKISSLSGLINRPK
jgi:hypothetical protein